MDAATRKAFDNLSNGDRALQNEAYYDLLEATNQPVPWAYEVWDELVAMLGHKNNHIRAIAAQLLSNLSKSDPDRRILRDFDALLAVTRDERFVTARHCLQSLWKIGTAGEPQRARYLSGLEQRFQDCAAEKNSTLIRYDIIQSLKNTYDATGDPAVRAKALELAETEPDLKYRKKYRALWPKALRT